MTDSDSRSPAPPPVAIAPATAPSSDPPEGLLDRLRAFVGRKAAPSIRDNLEEVLGNGESPSAEFTPEERAMLKNILGLRRLRVGEVMVPRADIVAVPRDVPIGDLLKVFASAGHSRLVVYGETLDDPVGMVHIRDLVAHLTRLAMRAPDDEAARRRPRAAGYDVDALDLSQPLHATGIIRHLLFVPPSMPAVDLLVKMQATRVHLALVIDEYGGTDGLVSIEDMVEQVVGDIEDEHDDESGPAVTQQPDGTWIADARVALDEVRETFGEAFAELEAAEDVDTLGGLLVTMLGRVPVRGEILPGPDGLEFEVLDADPRRVKRIKIGPRRGVARDARRRERRPVAAAPETGGARAVAAPAPPDRTAGTS